MALSGICLAFNVSNKSINESFIFAGMFKVSFPTNNAIFLMTVLHYVVRNLTGIFDLWVL